MQREKGVCSVRAHKSIHSPSDSFCPGPSRSVAGKNRLQATGSHAEVEKADVAVLCANCKPMTGHWVPAQAEHGGVGMHAGKGGRSHPGVP